MIYLSILNLVGDSHDMLPMGMNFSVSNGEKLKIVNGTWSDNELTSIVLESHQEVSNLMSS